MTAAIYIRARATALRLLNKFGRPMTLTTLADVVDPDPTRPWNPGTPTPTVHQVRAVVFPVDEVYVDGTTVLAEDLQAIVAASALPDGVIPTPKDVLRDTASGVTYNTVKVIPIEPGDVPVIHTMVVRR